MRILYLIPARKGSKGLPGKNIKMLGKKPLVEYSIDFALQIMKSNDELCISTDDLTIIKIAKKKGIKIPFIRPEKLSSDSASSYEVIIHAINHYESINEKFEAVLLLQPTSPFRSKDDFRKLIANYTNVDMVASVKEAKENPYFTLFEENNDGYLEKSKHGGFERRQDCPKVYSMNGSMYLINVESIKKSKKISFKKIKKILMPEERSLDIDTRSDWELAKFYLKSYDN